MKWFLCKGEPPIVKTIKKHKISSPSEKARTNRSLEDKKPIEQRLKENKSSEDKKPAEEELKKEKDALENGFGGIGVQTFTIHELAMATNNFRNDRLLGLGGFGRVYKGKLDNFNQFVAVKQLNRNGSQGNREFLVEVLMLSLLHHPNLVKLLGYCADGNQRLLVYEYMPFGSLNDHLHDPNSDTERLDWNTRMSIAAGTAKGLQHLHDKANPPVIYRDLKCSNILLGGYYPKIQKTGQLTLKSDVYSFGVVLLEILSGRQAFDNSRAAAEQNLVAWARPLLKDRRAFCQLADPALGGRYPMRGLYQALAVAAMCVQEQPMLRPAMADVVTTLTYLASQKYNPRGIRALPPVGTWNASSNKKSD
ncbi:hypothetical protein HPP92_025071 [Vanilla planifolia]|uniref:Protein kinase domain-containing protein n=1 Tax=Vanilla planifolia TaxID=51239 RepID=A0A835U8K3_VANPL|nr:hypothetical protein HPP92_025071 [Vanilla planifolia]